jgi:hypothetical protein
VNGFPALHSEFNRRLTPMDSPPHDVHHQHRGLLPNLGVWNFSDNINIILIISMILGWLSTFLYATQFRAILARIEDRLLELEGRRKERKKTRDGRVPKSRVAQVGQPKLSLLLALVPSMHQ